MKNGLQYVDAIRNNFRLKFALFSTLAIKEFTIEKFLR